MGHHTDHEAWKPALKKKVKLSFKSKDMERARLTASKFPRSEHASEVSKAFL